MNKQEEDGPNPVQEVVDMLKHLVKQSPGAPENGEPVYCYAGSAPQDPCLPCISVHALSLRLNDEKTKIVAETVQVKVSSDDYNTARRIRNKAMLILPNVTEGHDCSLWNKNVEGGVMHSSTIWTDMPINVDLKT